MNRTAMIASYLLRSERNGVIEIKLPTKAFHAAHWLLGDAFAQNSIEDGIDPSYLDRIVGMASAAQFDREALVTLCHMGMPHPAEPWDLRHMWSNLNIIGPATGSAEEHG